MRSVAAKLRQGYSYFGSGSYNSPEFNTFFESFMRSFTKELKKIQAKDLIFNKGHFNISGFFTLEDQAIYFSISDVRDGVCGWQRQRQMLIRTAKSYEDFTGGVNNYVDIEPDMAKKISIVFNKKHLYSTITQKKFYQKVVVMENLLVLANVLIVLHLLLWSCLILHVKTEW